MRTLSRTLGIALGALVAGCSPAGSAKNADKDKPLVEMPVVDFSAKRKQEAKLPLGDAEFKVASKDFVAEFKSDRKAAHAKYRGRTVEVTGVVASVGVNASGDPVLLIQSDPKSYDFTGCITAARYPGKVVAPGQTVTVKGRQHPDFPGANLLDTEVLKAEGPVPTAFTADTLVEEFAKDHAAAKKKHEEKWCAVTGVIESVDLNEFKAAGVTLKSTGKGPKIVANFAANALQNTAFKPGQTIEIIGQFSLFSSEREVTLYMCELTAAPK